LGTSLDQGVPDGAVHALGGRGMRLQGQRDRRWILWVSIAVLIVILVIVAYLYYIQPV
jgi:hypothetical protein